MSATNTTDTEATTPKVRRNRRRKVERHALEAYVPESWYGEEYYSRKVCGIVDAKLLDRAAALMDNVILYGPTGSAKTSLVYAFAAGFTGEQRRRRNAETGEMETYNVIDDEKRRPLIYVPCNGAVTPDQLFGGWVPTSDGSFQFVAGEVTLAVILGGIIYWDEVNFLATKIAAVSHGLLDKRRTIVVKDARGAGLCHTCAYVNGSSQYIDRKSPDQPLFTCSACGTENYTDTVFTASDQTFVVAAYNPGYRGTNPLNEAFLNRFAIKIPFGYNREIEEQMLYSGRLIDAADQLRRAYDDGVISVPVSTSMLIEFEKFALDEELGFAFAVENFLNAFDGAERQSVAQIMQNSAQAIMGELSDDDPVGNSAS